MELCRFFGVALIAFVIVMISLCQKGLQINDNRNQQIAEIVAKVYTEGRSKGVSWDTTSKVKLVEDVLKGKFCLYGAFRGRFFGLEFSGSLDPDPAQVADYLELDRDGNIFLFVPNG